MRRMLTSRQVKDDKAGLRWNMAADAEDLDELYVV